MSDFSVDWLALREPFDRAARSAALVARLAKGLGAPVRVLDLGCGAGNNLRYLAPRLPTPQAWMLVDRDPDLLARAALDAPAGVSTEAFRLDLASGLGALPLDRVDLVVGSALLDLVSARWLDELAEGCVARGLPVCMALTVDGRLRWTPPAPEDRGVDALFTRHQETDKGFGSALGPEAPAAFGAAFATRGWTVAEAESDWIVERRDRSMLTAMVDGAAEAAAELADPHEGAAVAAWRARRLGEIEAGTLSLSVGHRDQLALPPGFSRRGPRGV